MITGIIGLLPEGVSGALALSLLALSFVTSFITAAFSLGGGILMLSVMAITLPGMVVIPAHGLIQLGSNAGRMFIQRRQIDWTIALWMGLGAIPGALIGGQLADIIPEQGFGVAIALFILLTTWVKLPGTGIKGRGGWLAAGTLIGTVGMILSATGPLTAVFMRVIRERQRLVATHATIMVFQHLAKILVYMTIGFALAPWLPLAAAMMITGFAGTWAGSRFLARIPENVFRLGFRILLTAVALDLLRRSVFGG